MGRYIFWRILQAVPLLILISFLLFILMNSLGDPLSQYTSGDRPVTNQEREEMGRRLGLDKPILEQYLVWLIGNEWQMVDVRGDGTLMEPGTRKGVLRGDWGTSMVTKQMAWDRIQERLPNTLLLGLPAYLIVISLGLVIGAYSALHQYTLFDNLITAVTTLLYTMPVFFIGLSLIYLFGLQFKQWGLPALPIAGMYNVRQPETFGILLIHMILPVTTLVTIQLAKYVRFIRAAMLEVLNQGYISTARSKGLTERQVVFVHALRNATIPLVTLIGIDLPAILAGAVVTESLFAWPGIGRLFLESLDRSDYSVMMAILMLASVAVVVFQLLVDVVYSWLDPRISYGR